MSMCEEHTATGRWEEDISGGEDRKKRHTQQSQPDEGAASRLSPKPMSSYFSCSTLLGRPTKVYFSNFYRCYPSNITMEEYKYIDLINKIVKIRNLGIILHCQALFFQSLNNFIFSQYFSHLRQVFFFFM